MGDSISKTEPLPETGAALFAGLYQELFIIQCDRTVTGTGQGDTDCFTALWLPRWKR